MTVPEFHAIHDIWRTFGMYSAFNPPLMGFSLLGATCVFLIAVRSFFRKPLPPGPPRWPIVGSALHMPRHREWVTFSAWRKQYGEVVYVSVFGRPILVLNGPTAIAELLEKRSAIYSDRPRLPMAGELVGYEHTVMLSPYGARHRECRKLIASALGPRTAIERNQIQERKAVECIARILHTPDDFRVHVRWFVVSVVFQLSHGYDVKSLDDRLVRISEQSNLDFGKATCPGAFLVDMLPLLKYVPEWFPGAGFQTLAREWRETMARLKDEPYEFVQQQMADGVASPSFTVNCLMNNPTPTSEEDSMYRSTTSSIYGAGADTTVSAIESFFLAMSLYPQVQHKAQAEIDAALGSGQLPTLQDRLELPYIQALIKEVHRWNPVTPLALPHRLIQDDVYDGCRIPAGTTVIANNWGVMHDPTIYPDPFAFSPERYLSPNNKDTNPDPRQFAFGYGRRVCPGQAIAEASLFVMVVKVLAAFDIAKALDENGVPIEPDVEYSAEIISNPGPFGCRITPRSADIARAIETARDGA